MKKKKNDFNDLTFSEGCQIYVKYINKFYENFFNKLEAGSISTEALAEFENEFTQYEIMKDRIETRFNLNEFFGPEKDKIKKIIDDFYKIKEETIDKVHKMKAFI